MPVDSPQDLYGLPLPQFIPERQALVKALRSEKRRDEATEVAAMRKPSVAAWAVNQLVRTQSKAIRALLGAGDDLAQVQADAASGQRTADALRSANRRQRDALDNLLSAAQGLLSPEGHPLTAPTLERVTDTLRAASIDRASREQVISGCLSQELQFAGLGIGDLAAVTPARPTAHATKPTRTAKQAAEQPTKSGNASRAARGKAAASARAAGDDRKRRAQAKPEDAREAAAARARKAALTAARQTESKARRAATRADKELASAQARREEAAAALATAEERLTAAAQRAKQTTAELKTARRSLGDLEPGP